MSRKDSNNKGNGYGAVATILGPETYIDGSLRFKKSLKILGEFKGTIETEGLLIIGEEARVEANVKVGALILGGGLTGDVYAAERIEMLSTGRLIGNIKTPELRVETGVIFEGQCEMTKVKERTAGTKESEGKPETKAPQGK